MKIKMLVLAGVMAATLAVLAGMTQVGSIGVMVVRLTRAEPLQVAWVLPGSPAESAGITENSLLISVNGTNAVGIPPREFLSMVHGPAGTPVTLELADPVTSHTNKLTMKRTLLQVPDSYIDVFSSTNGPKPFLLAPR